MSYRSTAKGSLRLPFAAWALLTVTLTAAAGCADVSGQALQQDVAQLRQDLNSLTLAVHRGRGDTETVVGQLDRRTREQGAESSKQSAALNARLDTLSAEVARVSARVDELSQRVETLGRGAPSGGAAPRSGAPAPSGAAKMRSVRTPAISDAVKFSHPTELKARMTGTPAAPAVRSELAEGLVASTTVRPERRGRCAASVSGMAAPGMA